MILPGDSEAPPLQGFFRRAEAVATSAFLTIPYAGEPIAEFFNSSLVPRLAPKRDRLLIALRRGVRALEGGLQLVLIRIFPLS